MDVAYFVLIYDWLGERIDTFGMDLMERTMAWTSGMALVLATLWILVLGYRILTGQSRTPLLAVTTEMLRLAVIVTAATTMSFAGGSLHAFFTTGLGTEINHLFTDGSDTPAETIDRNLAWTQLALATIDAVQVPPGDVANNDAKNHAMLLAGIGTAGPPMTAAAMLLFYQFALALFIGLGPLFILCLAFDRTRDLFRRWLLHGIGTLFSMAVLAFVSSLALQLCLRVSAALWASSVTEAVTGWGAEGYSSQALQQGGLGLLLTVLIVSAPPMAAGFFQGTLGNFTPWAAVNGGGPSGNHPGPQGQPPGSSIDRGGYAGTAPGAAGPAGSAARRGPDALLAARGLPARDSAPDHIRRGPT